MYLAIINIFKNDLYVWIFVQNTYPNLKEWAKWRLRLTGLLSSRSHDKNIGTCIFNYFALVRERCTGVQ